MGVKGLELRGDLPMDKSYTPKEVAEMLKIAKTTVYELIKRGELNSYRVGNKMRIELKDIEEYIERKKEIKNDKVAVNKDKDEEKSGRRTELGENPSYFGGDAVEAGEKDFVICGQDLMLDILARHVEACRLDTRIYRSYIGSYNGLYSMYIDEADAATCHLWDAKSDSYNVPYVRSLLPGMSSIIIHLAKRTQGFYVLRGNPKKINNWEDLAREDVTFINREKGSGTRVLLDEKLKMLGISPAKINGYNRECLSHLAAASTIARGGADAAMGCASLSSQVKDIDFVPMQEERYELVIRKKDFEKKIVKTILKILNSEVFRMEIFGLGGYDIEEMGKVVARI